MRETKKTGTGLLVPAELKFCLYFLPSFDIQKTIGEIGNRF
jgi:hypothetical protein